MTTDSPLKTNPGRKPAYSDTPPLRNHFITYSSLVVSAEYLSDNSTSIEMTDDRIESMFPKSGFLKDVPPNVSVT